MVFVSYALEFEKVTCQNCPTIYFSLRNEYICSLYLLFYIFHYRIVFKMNSIHFKKVSLLSLGSKNNSVYKSSETLFSSQVKVLITILNSYHCNCFLNWQLHVSKKAVWNSNLNWDFILYWEQENYQYKSGRSKLIAKFLFLQMLA